jgi:large-conductance mechanosensitive channel
MDSQATTVVVSTIIGTLISALIIFVIVTYNSNYRWKTERELELREKELDEDKRSLRRYGLVWYDPITGYYRY